MDRRTKLIAFAWLALVGGIVFTFLNRRTHPSNPSNSAKLNTTMAKSATPGEAPSSSDPSSSNRAVAEKEKSTKEGDQEKKIKARGRILNSEGQAVEGAEVFFCVLENGAKKSLFRDITQEGGYYEVENFVYGTYEIIAVSGQHGTGTWGPTLFQAEGDVTIPDIVLLSNGVLAGRAQTLEGSPKAGHITAYPVNDVWDSEDDVKAQGARRGSSEFGKDGEFRIAGLLPGKYYLFLSTESIFEMDRSKIYQTDKTDILITPEKSSLKLTVVDSLGNLLEKNHVFCLVARNPALMETKTAEEIFRLWSQAKSPDILQASLLQNPATLPITPGAWVYCYLWNLDDEDVKAWDFFEFPKNATVLEKTLVAQKVVKDSEFSLEIYDTDRRPVTFRAFMRRLDSPLDKQKYLSTAEFPDHLQSGRYFLNIFSTEDSKLLLAPLETTIELLPGKHTFSFFLEPGGNLQVHLDAQASMSPSYLQAWITSVGEERERWKYLDFFNVEEKNNKIRPGRVLMLGNQVFSTDTMPAGRYRIRFEADGFVSKTVDFTIQPRQVTKIDLQLQPSH